MIVTLTANPSLDRTVELPGRLERGAVLRATASTATPAGKGVNVSLALHRFGGDTVAVLPGRASEPLVAALVAARVPVEPVAIEGALRSNLTLTEADGTTTKVNEPGPLLSGEEWERLAAAVLAHARTGAWVALCGSLPPGVPLDAYAGLARAVSALGARVAVDTSGAAASATVGEAPVDLVKPNAEELVELTGDRHDPAAVEADPLLAAELAGRLLRRDVGAVLCTLGSAGALLVTQAGAWHAPAPVIQPRSTVGAGDSALAGYLLADTRGAQADERLRRAVAHGAAAAALPGSEMPAPADVHDLLPLVSVTSLPLTGIAAGH
ncbi:1-phosphofructokinase family hexose kinase [Naasia sp. SYSU D00948]|uniref:1-phosphofructokinase family hexose kinase n=1 Tax=Naasia sp. SYSU D00948 TaxID=2817379 RepID=UPI001B304C92|nr:1-phosphofructokinase family hexose kinase [Naasia sp. SYSU D00948]